MADVLQRFPEIASIHKACEAVPTIDADSFSELVTSMSSDGQLDPVKVDKSRQLLDGRNRLAACFLLDLQPRIEVTAADPWVVAQSNIARRHLTAGQRAAFAAKLLGVEQSAAGKRRTQALKKGKEQPVRLNSATRAGRATELAAERAGTNRDSVEKFCKLPSTEQAKVKSGNKSLNAAVATNRPSYK